jgi:hypothetical protein
MSLRRGVFFDRDGTLMEEVHYCGDPTQVRVYAGAGEARPDRRVTLLPERSG